MSILDDILAKRKIKSVDNLSEQERSTYNAIKKDIETRITLDTIKKFCESEIKTLQNEWLDIDNKGLTDLSSMKKEIIIKARIKNYIAILSLFWKTENIQKRGVKRAKEILNK